MKCIGILGGMSATSSQLYYQILCDLTRARCGGLTSPDLVLRSLNFAPLQQLMAAGDWESIGACLNGEAKRLEEAGADFLVLATNTLHKVAAAMMNGVNIPLLDVIDVTAQALTQANLSKPLLLGTRFTMEESFYRARLGTQNVLATVPEAENRALIDQIIFGELCQNTVRQASAAYCQNVVNDMADAGADSVILGCTELGLVITDATSKIPVFDTTRLHCEAALDLALS